MIFISVLWPGCKTAEIENVEEFDFSFLEEFSWGSRGPQVKEKHHLIGLKMDQKHTFSLIMHFIIRLKMAAFILLPRVIKLN